MKNFQKKRIHLTLVRHGQSESNKNKTFTGWTDSGLTQKGREESTSAGIMLRSAQIEYSRGYTSFLTRAVDTYSLIITELAKDKSEIKCL